MAMENRNAEESSERTLVLTRICDAPRSPGLQSMDRARAPDALVGAARVYRDLLRDGSAAGRWRRISMRSPEGREGSPARNLSRNYATGAPASSPTPLKTPPASSVTRLW